VETQVTSKPEGGCEQPGRQGNSDKLDKESNTNRMQNGQGQSMVLRGNKDLKRWRMTS